MSVYTQQNISFRNLGNTSIPTTTHSIFGIYRYPAKFIPQVISYICTKYSQPGMSIIDPFAGSGTVGLVAKIYGQNYELWDLNPMLGMLHEVAVSNPPDFLDLNEMLHQMSVNRRSFVPKWSNLSYWFSNK